jgi:hypothetical protein
MEVVFFTLSFDTDVQFRLDGWCRQPWCHISGSILPIRTYKYLGMLKAMRVMYGIKTVYLIGKRTKYENVKKSMGGEKDIPLANVGIEPKTFALLARRSNQLS